MQITLLALSPAVQGLADTVKAALDAEEQAVRILSGPDCTAQLFAEGGFYLLLGAGASKAPEKPDTAHELAGALTGERPDIRRGGSPLLYAAIVSGDGSSALMELDSALTSLGGRCIGHATMAPGESPERAVRTVETWIRHVGEIIEGEEDPTLVA